MEDKIRPEFIVEMEANKVTLHKTNPKASHTIELIANINYQLVDEITTACETVLKKYYTANELSEKIIPLIINEYAVNNYVHEHDMYRVGSDGSIFYNDSFLDLDSNFAVAIDTCYLNGLDANAGPEYLKETLDVLNIYGDHLSKSEAKYMYEKSKMVFSQIEKERVNAVLKAVPRYISFIQSKNKCQEIKADPLMELNSIIKSGNSAEESEQGNIVALSAF